MPISLSVPCLNPCDFGAILGNPSLHRPLEAVGKFEAETGPSLTPNDTPARRRKRDIAGRAVPGVVASRSARLGDRAGLAAMQWPSSFAGHTERRPRSRRSGIGGCVRRRVDRSVSRPAVAAAVGARGEPGVVTKGPPERGLVAVADPVPDGVDRQLGRLEQSLGPLDPPTADVRLRALAETVLKASGQRARAEPDAPGDLIDARAACQPVIDQRLRQMQERVVVIAIGAADRDVGELAGSGAVDEQDASRGIRPFWAAVALDEVE